MNVHFLGIGGVGMSALAERLLEFGLQISGSDACNSEFVMRLLNKGIKVYIDKTPLSVIEKADVIIYSSAIKNDDACLDYAKKLNKCIYSRGEVLGELFKVANFSVGVAGSHGKTTATSMIANVLKLSNLPFAAFIGGLDATLGNYFYNGNKILISEVCEYDKNIRHITANLSLVLNIDDDHMDTYKTIKNLKNEFFLYLDRSKTQIVNSDDALLKNHKGSNVISYGINNPSDYQAYNIINNKGKYSFSYLMKNGEENRVELSVYGKHNIYNALATIAVCDTLGVPHEIIKIGLNAFEGVKRRFEYLGCINGKNIIADYCHHPEEIKATLRLAKEVFNGDYLAVFQPHTYSRTKLLFNKFLAVFKSENLVVFNEYSAREEYDYLGSAKYLSSCVENSKYFEDFNDLVNFIKQENSKNILILGAGNLYDKIEKYTKNSKV